MIMRHIEPAADGVKGAGVMHLPFLGKEPVDVDLCRIGVRGPIEHGDIAAGRAYVRSSRTKLGLTTLIGRPRFTASASMVSRGPIRMGYLAWPTRLINCEGSLKITGSCRTKARMKSGPSSGWR